ncbi:hypothetical protein EBB07_28700 [Paenibacillaceae bacterium]|nr:hypothetical protein EBB07_28700 [Paenibacillaceae bacterium]
MKIIKTDNYDRDSVADILIAENINTYYGEKMVDLLNDKFSGEGSSDFYKLVEDNYKLWRGMEELV